MDEPGLERIKDGKQMFSIDQQPYLQGFLAVSLLNGFVNYGLDLPTKPDPDRTWHREQGQRRRDDGGREGRRALKPNQ